MKNNFNIKEISNLLGHAKEIISADVYGDTQEIIEDCLYAIEPFIDDVIQETRCEKYFDYSDMSEMKFLADEYIETA